MSRLRLRCGVAAACLLGLDTRTIKGAGSGAPIDPLGYPVIETAD